MQASTVTSGTAGIVLALAQKKEKICRLQVSLDMFLCPFNFQLVIPCNFQNTVRIARKRA